MAIDFSFLEGDTYQKEAAPVKSDTANVTIRVDADSMLLCDGEYMDQQFKAGVITKIQLPTGQHLLEFLSEENPDVKVEKVVDFIEAGKSYLVVVNELKAAISKHQTDAAIALGTKKTYNLTVTGYENLMCAMMVARKVLGWSSAESREKLSTLPAVLVQSEDLARIEALASQFASEGVQVSVETRNGLGELVDETKLQTVGKKEKAEEYRKMALDYSLGRNGKPQDKREAVKWTRKAAELGDIESIMELAEDYDPTSDKLGEGITKDNLEAIFWYKKAAEQGNKKAQVGLIFCYLTVRCKGRDLNEALKWALLAAERGGSREQFIVGYVYERMDSENRWGEVYECANGTTLFDEMVKWYRKAAAQGHKGAKKCLEEKGIKL